MLKLIIGWLRHCVGAKKMRGSNLTNDIALHDYIIKFDTCVIHELELKKTYGVGDDYMTI